MNTLLIAAWIACQSLDIGTTVYALNRPGFREGNHNMRGSRLYAFKITMNIGAGAGYVGVRKMVPRAAWTVPTLMAVGGCVPGVMNLRTISRSQGHQP